MPGRRIRLANELATEAVKLIEMGHVMLAKAVALGGEAPLSKPKLPDVVADYSDFQGILPEAKAKALYEGRRIRDRLFPSHLFGEPAWDILLDLYIAAKRGVPLQVTSVCIGARVPLATGHRHIGLIEECGLIDRSTDPSDGRRSMLTLSPAGLSLMDAFFATTERSNAREDEGRPKLRLASSISGQSET